jgi:hypothetical protein
MHMRTLSRPASGTAEHWRNACRANYGRVRLSATPAGSFSFRSEASWPAESYEGYVLRGILEALASLGAGPEFGAEFVLEEVGWHPVDSSAEGYYLAAKQATEQILMDAAAPAG